MKDRDIISASGHRNAAALKSYTSDSSVEVKRQMSDTLSSLTHENMSVVPVSVPVSMNVCLRSVQYSHQVPTAGPLLPYTTTCSLYLPAVGPSLYNSTTTLSEIDFLEIDDNYPDNTIGERFPCENSIIG